MTDRLQKRINFLELELRGIVHAINAAPKTICGDFVSRVVQFSDGEGEYLRYILENKDITSYLEYDIKKESQAEFEDLPKVDSCDECC